MSSTAPEKTVRSFERLLKKIDESHRETIHEITKVRGIMIETKSTLNAVAWIGSGIGLGGLIALVALLGKVSHWF